MSPIKEVQRLFLSKHYSFNLKKISELQSSYYRNISRVPLRSGCKSLGICGAQFFKECTQQLDSPDTTNIPMRYTVYEMMLLMMDW